MEKIKLKRIADKQKVVIKVSKNILINLYTRWCDEKEYEDFNDYEKLLKSYFNKHLKKKGINFIKGIKSPFGALFIIEGYKFKLGINSKRISIKHIS